MATHHTAQDVSISGTSVLTPLGVNWKVIRVKVDYIRPRIINKPLTSTSLLGINGSFFSSGNYQAAPSYGVGINWNKYGTDNYIYNGKAGEEISRGTLCIYTYNGSQEARVVSVATANAAINLMPNFDMQAMIGGGDLALGMSNSDWYNQIYKSEQWENKKFGILDTALIPTRRTGIGLRKENGESIAYLAVSTSDAVLADLRPLFSDYLGCSSAIFLDGSASSQYRYKDANNNIVAYGGTENPPRWIWNMIQITNVN